jgi:hypothetical protein
VAAIGTRWASWNMGVFLCIQCGGHHRKLGTHVSKVKSITLDSWSDEQVQVCQHMDDFYKTQSVIELVCYVMLYCMSVCLVHTKQRKC